MDGAIVLFESLLGEPIEGESGHGAVQMRGGHTPGAIGAAPATEVVLVDPDQTFVHTAPTLDLLFGMRARTRRAEHMTALSPEGELLPCRTVFSTDLPFSKV